ncbi:hypothetical protein [Marispirochaeta sp.]|uniref:hypothetical protein n=1 Tax=Marispirochaeta sp. TaxID=2038653 RepID=UPI0029C6ABCF|nr:hypothetical protein [Marispirochaeta sp.]
MVIESTSSDVLLTYYINGSSPGYSDKDLNILNEQISKKNKIDDIESKIEKVKDFLSRIKRTILNEFEESIKTYYLYKSSEKRAYLVAISFRNVLEHLKGELWKKVKNINEQRCKMRIILERLVLSELNINDITIARIERSYADLHNDLSIIAKKLGNEQINIVFDKYINILSTLQEILNV